MEKLGTSAEMLAGSLNSKYDTHLEALYLYEFECLECEGHMLIEVNSLQDDTSWPRFCCHCGNERVFLDWKKATLIATEIDVRTTGSLHKTEDIASVNYTTDGKYQEYGKCSPL